MSAHAMKPSFSDRAGYRDWLRQWRTVYRSIADAIRERKLLIKTTMRAGSPGGRLQKELGYQRVMAHKLMSLLGEAEQRWARIKSMHRQMAGQAARLPLTFSDCRTIDFHFNKGSLEFGFLPMWVAKARGESFYIAHLSAEAPWSTRETPQGSTKGMLRFRNCSLHIDVNGEATISPRSMTEQQLVTMMA